MTRHLPASLVVLSMLACGRPARDQGAGVTPAEVPIRQVSSLIELPSLEVLREEPPVKYFVDADGSIGISQPGPSSSVLRISRDGGVSTLVADLAFRAPLQLLGGETGPIRAMSLDGKVGYELAPDVGPGAWSAAPANGENVWTGDMMWRAAATRLQAGLLRVVTPSSHRWSVVDFHVAGSLEPRWRVNLDTESACVAATLLPEGALAVLLLVDSQGKSVLQARSAADGNVVWATPLGTPATGWQSLHVPLAHSPDGEVLALIVDSPAQCPSCSAIQLVDTKQGTLLRRIELSERISFEGAHLGLTEQAVWLFKYQARRVNHQFERPEYCTYHSFSIATGKPRPAPAPEWGFDSCKLWGLAAVPNQSGVVGLGWQDSKLLILRATEAP